MLKLYLLNHTSLDTFLTLLCLNVVGSIKMLKLFNFHKEGEGLTLGNSFTITD